MSITVMANNGIPNIKAEMDGALFNLFAERTDCVIGGIGSQFNVVAAGSISGLVVTVPSGQAIIGGRIFKIEGTESITLNANSVNVLCLRIDLTAAAGSEGKLYINSSQNTISQQDLNNGGTLRDMPIYEFVTSSSSVTTTTSLRNIKNSSPRSIIQMSENTEQKQLSTNNVTICYCGINDIFRLGYHEIDPYNGGVKINKNGWYRVTGSVYIVDSTSGIEKAGCYIQKNNVLSENEITSQYLNVGGDTSFRGNISSGEKIVPLSAGDVIYLCARVKSSNTNAYAGHRWLLVEKIALS